MDDLVERFLKSLGFVFGSFILIYVLIANSGQRPTGLSLVIYDTMNSIFLWGFRILVASVVGLILFECGSYYFKHKEEKKLQLEEKEKRQQQELRREAEELEEERQRRISKEAAHEASRLLKLELQRRLTEKEQHLKTRSAQDANAEALKHFL
jgi:biopolymer transport protein ExbB/TolQ